MRPNAMADHCGERLPRECRRAGAFLDDGWRRHRPVLGGLHEVDDEQALLDAIGRVLSSNGILHVNVPNATSLHRRLARAMGLIGDEHELTARNRALEQYRIYDRDSLVGLLSSSGFEIESTGGYFMKPFTHSQMETLGFLSEAMIEGLYDLGCEYADLAAEIYVNAGLCK